MARWLAYAHPAWMVASLALTALALRAGLALRRRRRVLGPRNPRARRAHLRLAKPAVGLLLVGLLGGPPSAVLLRGWEPFRTFHGVLGLLVAGLFVAAAVVGRRIEKRRSRAFDTHALLGMLAALGAAIAAVAGFVLLP
ncbi:MAG: DUF4079 family protein [Myxococcales bacterium]|nr:DUF4079 family protein [Myxococcales bacterium]